MFANNVPGTQVREFCGFGTREDCSRSNPNSACDKLHFKKIINKHTDGTSAANVILSLISRFREVLEAVILVRF